MMFVYIIAFLRKYRFISLARFAIIYYYYYYKHRNDRIILLCVINKVNFHEKMLDSTKEGAKKCVLLLGISIVIQPYK